MKDLNTELREAYIRALTLVIGVPVYDTEAPAVSTLNYVLLTDINAREISTKTSFYQDVSISLLVVTKFANPSRGNFKIADSIANTITQNIIGSKVLDMKPNFKVVKTSKDGDRTLQYKDATYNVYTRALTLRSKIVQLT